MQAKSTRWFLSTLALTLTLPTLQAQPTEGFNDAGYAPAPSDLLPRFIADCGTASTALCAITGDPVELVNNIVTLQIAAFKPEDLAAHAYVMVGVSESGEGSGSTVIDEFGMMHAQDTQVLRTGDDLTQAVEKQYYLVTTAISTLEAQVTLDLYEVRVWPFLHSLQMGIQSGIRQAIAGGFRPWQGPSVLGDPLLMQADIRLSIQGEHLSIDEVLDIVYLETGCAVEQTETAMVITGCR